MARSNTPRGGGKSGGAGGGKSADPVRDMVARRRRERAERGAARPAKKPSAKNGAAAADPGAPEASGQPAAPQKAAPSKKTRGADAAPPRQTQTAADEQDLSPAAPRGSRLGARLAQLGLPLVAAVIVGAVFWNQSAETGDLPVGVADLVEIKTTGKLSNPHFTGATQRGEPVSLRAVEARPDGLDFNLIELTEVVGEVQTLDGRVITLTALEALYDRENNEVSGAGGVVITTNDGYSLRTERLSADIDAMTARSETAVRGEGPEGEITADAMRVDLSEDVAVLFEGNVRVMIDRVVQSRATGE